MSLQWRPLLPGHYRDKKIRGYESVISHSNHFGGINLHDGAGGDMKVALHLVAATFSSKAYCVRVDVSEKECHGAP